MLKNAIELRSHELCAEADSQEIFRTNVLWASLQNNTYDLDKKTWIDNTPFYPSSDTTQELGEIKTMLKDIMTHLGMLNLYDMGCIENNHSHSATCRSLRLRQ